MYLRSLKLRGFKSFTDPIEITFERGVSVIVGPNGSGKSNIGDGIVWAAGSLSPSQLRAEKPDDVLFAGSGSRKPSDNCEVELVFDAADGDAPLPYREISIARRLHRGGEGQYLLNRAPVRRLDITELLADAGLGGEMHAIISQGKVEQVLSSKPQERRALIEEAAGLGSFKQRRHRAELKLARVRVDVDRARDLEAEVRKRLRPLAMQASAAERAAKLADEIQELGLRLRRSELARLEGEQERIQERRSAVEVEKRRADELVEGLLVERRGAEEELAQAASRHEQSTAALYRLRSAVERLGLRHENAEEAARQLRADAEQIARLAALPRDETPLEELARAETELREASRSSRTAMERREGLEAAARLAAERLRSLERSIAEREGLPPAARALADAGERLALSALDVDPGYERAVATALAWRGSAVLAPDAASAAAMLERARREGLGPLAVLLPGGAVTAGSPGPPVPNALRLRDLVRPLPGGERVAALLEGVWLVEQEQLVAAAHGTVVTKDGHCYDVERGELWFEGETAKSVLLELDARRRALVAEVERLGVEAQSAAADASGVFETERTARERVQRARMAAAKVPKPIDPREVELLAGLATAAETLASQLGAALVEAQRFEAPLRARVDAGNQITTELGSRLRQLGQREAELRRSAGEVQERLSQIAIEAARTGEKLREVRSRLPEGTQGESLPETEEAAAKEQLERLVRRREQIGQVNPLAAQEHAKESARLAEIQQQREDLDRSLDELETLRAELTAEVERRFSETFSLVERHFAEVAATLFPGGEGRLLLTGGTDTDGEGDGQPEVEVGVEVELRPAGKKVTRLSLLSGGEKSLGALSFLFALFLARPCPFYLLDEVEAALDDTNIGRFVDLLRRYADRAQFIVVTHQKRTMEAADILYGVTMGSDGISQIVSRRMREIAAAGVAGA